MFGVTGGATRQANFVTHHRNDGVVGETALARAVVIQYVTKPKLTLLHSFPEYAYSGWNLRGNASLADAVEPGKGFFQGSPHGLGIGRLRRFPGANRRFCRD